LLVGLGEAEIFSDVARRERQLLDAPDGNAAVQAAAFSPSEVLGQRLDIAIGALLPRAQGFILADMMNAVGLATIFLTLAQSAISLYSFATLLTLIGSGIIVVMEMLAGISILQYERNMKR
jgi:hypothetical protein